MIAYTYIMYTYPRLGILSSNCFRRTVIIDIHYVCIHVYIFRNSFNNLNNIPWNNSSDFKLYQLLEVFNVGSRGNIL